MQQLWQEMGHSKIQWQHSLPNSHLPIRSSWGWHCSRLKRTILQRSIVVVVYFRATGAAPGRKGANVHGAQVGGDGVQELAPWLNPCPAFEIFTQHPVVCEGFVWAAVGWNELFSFNPTIICINSTIITTNHTWLCLSWNIIARTSGAVIQNA